jgi:hypothetical protein
MRVVWAILAIGAGSATAGGYTAAKAGSLPAEAPVLLALPSVKEPSGLCYHAGRASLFVVDDCGAIAEFTPDGRVLHERRLGAMDFEGITSDPATGLLYVAIEGAEEILEVDPQGLQAKRRFAVPRTFGGRAVMKAGGQGIEAIVFVPDSSRPNSGTFFVANQSMDLNATEDISAICEVEAPLRGTGEVRIVNCIEPGVIDIADLYYDSARDILYAISDKANLLLALTRDGKALGSWKLPGSNQEGLAVTPDGMMFIAQDSGGVLRLKVDWGRMAAR